MISSEVRDMLTTFMKDNDFDDIVQKFCNGSKVKEHARKQFNLLQEYLNKMYEESPNDLEYAIKQELSKYTFEMLIKDLELMLKTHIYVSIQNTLELSDAFSFRTIVIENTKQAIDEDNQVLVEWTNKTCEDVIKEMMEAIHFALITHTFSNELIEDIKKLIDGIENAISNNN